MHLIMSTLRLTNCLKRVCDSVQTLEAKKTTIIVDIFPLKQQQHKNQASNQIHGGNI